MSKTEIRLQIKLIWWNMTFRVQMVDEEQFKKLAESSSHYYRVNDEHWLASLPLFGIGVRSQSRKKKEQLLGSKSSASKEQYE